MNKNDYSGCEVISVYQFMQMCGLECAMKKKVAISHKAMQKKLMLRYKSFPSAISPPISVSFKEITKERVKIGAILLVEDDYKNVIGYRKPKLLHEMKINLTDEEREAIRQRLIEEVLESKMHQDIYKPGYQKYLYRKAQKLVEEEKEDIDMLLACDQRDNENGESEEYVKVRKLQKKW